MLDKSESFIDSAIKNHLLTHATIEVLTACNCRCVHCYIPEHNAYGLPFETLSRIFRDLREIGVFEITFTGGELFVRSDACEILKTARNLGFNLQLFSNVSLLTRSQIAELSKMYIYNISCTVFSLVPQIHDAITGVPGSHEKTLENIELLREYNVPVEIKTIIMKANADAYVDLIPYCAERNIKYFATTNIFPKQNKEILPTEMQLSDFELKKVLSDIDPLRNFDVPRNLTKNEYICNSIHHSVYIDCKGDVFPCSLLPLKLGSVLDESISAIWNDKSRFRGVLDYTWFDVPECWNCKSKKFCYRCTGIAYAESNSLLEKDISNCNISVIRAGVYEM